MITNCKIQLDGKNPHFTKLQISQWSTFDRVETLQHWAQWNINSLMVKYEQIWNSILSHTKRNSRWPGIGSWIASFRITIISTTREGLFVNVLTGFYCILSKILTIYVRYKMYYQIITWYCRLITQKFHMISGETWVDVMIACRMTSRWTQYCWLLKMIIVCGERISTSHYNAWCHW